MPQGYVFGFVLKCCFIIANSSFKFTLLDTGQSAYLISAYNKRITLYCSTTISFGALIVFQIYFGQSSKKIRLVQIRFRIDYLVKVLDRKNVVFKIQCIPSNSHYSFCIDLGTKISRKKQQKQYYILDHQLSIINKQNKNIAFN
ncbi:hypothetical protein SDC9_78137 [bioreactor metagenome]|uniref:Transmembrane protein n=1 Tax=bioreactor metagenome TaxID=1076179 RepID=A0A644YUQ6_9ZZZZ